MKLILFDFDKTLTSKDSLIEFARYDRSKISFYSKILFLTPVIILYKLGVLNSQQTKERFLGSFFKGLSNDELKKLGKNFSNYIIPKILNPILYDNMLKHIQEGDKVVLVSASMDIWLNEWCSKHNIDLICTKAKFNKDNLFEGKIDGLNVKGHIKKKLVLQKYSLSQFNEIIVYGNKGLDNELFKLATSKKNQIII